MEIYTLLRKGLLHKNFCEDFLFTGHYKDSFNVFAVFDGCSSGRDAHFASALMGKCLQAALKTFNEDSSERRFSLFTNELIYQTLMSLKETRNRLMLDTMELLSTLIVFVYSPAENIGEIIALGDGFVSINGAHYPLDQDNVPDYPAYHLDKINKAEDLKTLVDDSGRRFLITNPEDICISTDGILSFDLSGTSAEINLTADPVQFLVDDTFLRNNPAMLPRKCNMLKSRYGLVNQDDIALIRIMK